MYCVWVQFESDLLLKIIYLNKKIKKTDENNVLYFTERIVLHAINLKTL